MKTVVCIAVAALAWVILAQPSDSPSGCPSVDQSSIWLPPDRAQDLAALLNAADVLNNRMGVCVIGGGWGVQTGAYFISVKEPGKTPNNRRYQLAELQSLADLGKR